MLNFLAATTGQNQTQKDKVICGVMSQNGAKTVMKLQFKTQNMARKFPDTLAAEMFWVGYFLLEIEEIIFCPILDIQEPLKDFHRNEAFF